MPPDIHVTIAELGGILAGLYILHNLSEDIPNSRETVTLWCDCEKVVKVLQRKSYKGLQDYLQQDSDFIEEAKMLIKTMPIQKKLKWVEGHYEGDKLLEHQLNDIAHGLV